METILSDSTRKLLWFEITADAVSKIILLCHYNFRHAFVPYIWQVCIFVMFVLLITFTINSDTVSCIGFGIQKSI